MKVTAQQPISAAAAGPQCHTSLAFVCGFAGLVDLHELRFELLLAEHRGSVKAGARVVALVLQTSREVRCDQPASQMASTLLVCTGPHGQLKT